MPLPFLRLPRAIRGICGAWLLLAMPVGDAQAQPPVTLPPTPPSPVAYFRQLLAAVPTERERLLAGKSPQQLRVLTNSIRIYLALPAAEREARLRTMELRSHLAPLLRLAPAERVARLKTIPNDYREVIQERLTYWDRLSTNVQRQVLEDEKATRFGSSVLVCPPPLPPVPLAAALSPAQQAVLEPWKAKTPAQQYEVIAAFTNLFDLPPGLKSKALDPLPLSTTERALIEKALETFRRMQPAQRQACVNGFLKFAELPPSERVQFLRNAEAWQKMPPEERQRWRDLVNRMPPLPPLPPGFGAPPMPPIPRPPATPASRSYAASNSLPSR